MSPLNSYQQQIFSSRQSKLGRARLLTKAGLWIAILAGMWACRNAPTTDIPEQNSPPHILQPEESTLATRMLPPQDFRRKKVAANSFMHHTRRLPLKATGSSVLLYDGSPKSNQSVHVAVFDQYIGTKNLHQCADAAMRLKADYLRSTAREDDIQFQLTNGHVVDYRKWKQGYRIALQGNNTKWVKTAAVSDSDDTYWEYLELIFTYAGTLSLSHELQKKEAGIPLAGDLWLHGGSPGHAVLVVDQCTHSTTGENLYLLAQSYMPAQEMHIVKNPVGRDISPWYRLPQDGSIVTPEWTFEPDQLYLFID